MSNSVEFPAFDHEPAYTPSRDGVLAVEHRHPGVIPLRGISTLDFLHRMSTNQILGLPDGHVRSTVLTTAIGRCVDVVSLVRRGDGGLLVTGHGRAETVRDWLRRHIFFGDEVQLDPPDGTFHRWGLYGPGAEAALAGLGEGPLPSGDQALDRMDGFIWRGQASGEPLPGFVLLAGPELHRAVHERFGDCTESPREAFDARRIELGLASPDDDLEPETIPMEAGLWNLIRFDKGCYIGQEVIARMESRNRLARRLVGARMESPAPAPQDILVGETPVGRLTSIARSPRFGVIGLGIARASTLEHLPLDATLSPAGRPARLVELPFEPSPG